VCGGGRGGCSDAIVLDVWCRSQHQLLLLLAMIRRRLWWVLV
jgi:hypothetical protein